MSGTVTGQIDLICGLKPMIAEDLATAQIGGSARVLPELPIARRDAGRNGKGTAYPARSSLDSLPHNFLAQREEHHEQSEGGTGTGTGRVYERYERKPTTRRLAAPVT